MSKKQQVWAACAALLLPLVAVAGPRDAPQLFSLPALEVENTRPAISFAIPAYELTLLERQTVATCLVLEAASQGEIGMRGVMAVIRNRARAQPELFAATVLRERQFSAFNRVSSGQEPLERLIGRAQRDPTWFRAITLVDEAAGEDWADPTGGATHYARTAVHTRWSGGLAKTVTIGAHAFFR